MTKSPKNVTSLQAGVAAVVLLAGIGGAFWVLDPDSTRPDRLSIWLGMKPKPPQWVDLWRSVRFRSVNFSYIELQGELRKDQVGASQPHISSAASSALIEPVSFRIASPGFLTWGQKTALEQSVLSQLQHGNMLADVTPDLTTETRGSSALNYRIEVKTLPEGLLFCKLRNSVDQTITLGQPQPGYTSIPLGGEAYGGYPTECFTTHYRLYDDLRKAIKTDLGNMVDRVHPEQRQMPRAGFAMGGRGQADDFSNVQLYPPHMAPPVTEISPKEP